MLVDWLTLRYDVKTESDLALVKALSAGLDVCVREDSDGVVVSQWWPRESQRSDSHRLNVSLSLGRIQIEGSPARLNSFNNVFGDSDPSRCAAKMLRAVSAAKGVILPPLQMWKCTRIDLTQNYDCGVHAREALDALGKASGGRLRVNTTYVDTVYWNLGSDLWSAKAYLKGPDLVRLIRKGRAQATEEQVQLAQRLLRVELMLRRHVLKRLNVHIVDFTEALAMEQFKLFAGKVLPDNGAVITGEQQLLERLSALYPRRQANNVYRTWLAMREAGAAAVRQRMGRDTWFRHRKMLIAAGLTPADFNAAKVLQFRPRAIVAAPVDSWDQLRRAA
jgi:hypothetical protein